MHRAGAARGLRTHKHLYMGEAPAQPGATDDAAATAAGHVAAHGHAIAGHGKSSLGRAIGKLLIATVGVAVIAEFLVAAADHTARELGWSEVFVGVIVVAIIGNAAEHSTAIIMAAKNKMDAAINIAVGSSIQIALFVAPLLVFLSYALAPAGRGPLDLIFTQMEVLAIVACSVIMAFCANDGESHWMEGIQLLAVYVILGIAFYFLPVVSTVSGVPAAGH